LTKTHVPDDLPLTPPQIHLPPDTVEALEPLRALSDDDIARLVAVLDREPPIVVRRHLLETAQRELPDALGIPELLDALIDIETTRFGNRWSHAEAAFGVAESWAAETHSEAIRDAFEQRLLRLLTTQSLPVAAKAIDIFLSHERLYDSGRIVTDIRPVFSDDPTEPPGAAVLVHVLQLAFTESGERRLFFVALDDADLAQLDEIVHRAKDKSLTLRRTLQDAGLLAAGWEEPEMESKDG